MLLPLGLEMQITDEEMLQRIIVDSDVMVGKPVIKDTRLTVEHILSLLARGSTAEDILVEYERLTDVDIQACLLFASRSLENTDFMPLMAG